MRRPLLTYLVFIFKLQKEMEKKNRNPHMMLFPYYFQCYACMFIKSDLGSAVFFRMHDVALFVQHGRSAHDRPLSCRVFYARGGLLLFSCQYNIAKTSNEKTSSDSGTNLPTIFVLRYTSKCPYAGTLIYLTQKSMPRGTAITMCQTGWWTAFLC